MPLVRVRDGRITNLGLDATSVGFVVANSIPMIFPPAQWLFWWRGFRGKKT